MKNKENYTIRYYKGLIRDLQAQVKNALARIKKLEEKIRKIPLASNHQPSNMEMFSSDDTQRGVLPESISVSSGGIGGLTESEIKALVISWINNGELPISIHDHTDGNKGGDAYANKGAALQ